MGRSGASCVPKESVLDLDASTDVSVVSLRPRVVTARRPSPDLFSRRRFSMTRRSARFRYQSARRPAAVLVALQSPHQSAHEVATSSLELARLARGLGIDVVRTLHQPRTQARSSLLSAGRLEELLRLTSSPDTPEDERLDIVLVDGVLSASQQHALELALGVQVLDRSAVILQVFRLRARTREARLQVQLAEALYQAPRIRDDRSLGDREGGGGRGGRGHSNVELRKQQNREHAATLRRELATLPARAAVRRQRREALPLVALVGYTNAGKSSLMQALTGRHALIEDELFATLDLTVHALAGRHEPRVLVSDTVGFLANLPHELLASFRATLQEAREADLLLVVVDASSPELHEQLHVTHDTLRQVGADDVPEQLVLNKCDRLSGPQREALQRQLPDAWLVSAHAAGDMTELRARLQKRFAAPLLEGSVLVPYTKGAVLGDMHRCARVLNQRHTARGTQLRLRAPAEAWARWTPLRVSSPCDR
jgi:GTP-binding protein HflX